MRTSQHWLSRLLECTQSLCQHQNSWKGWGWVGGALRDGGWEWGRGGESGRGGFARTVVGTPAIGAAYRGCGAILRSSRTGPRLSVAIIYICKEGETLFIRTENDRNTRP